MCASSHLSAAGAKDATTAHINMGGARIVAGRGEWLGFRPAPPPFLVDRGDEAAAGLPVIAAG